MTAEDTDAMIADALQVEIGEWWQSADLPSACYLSARIGYLAGRSASRQRVERLEGALRPFAAVGAQYAEYAATPLGKMLPLEDADAAMGVRTVEGLTVGHFRAARAALEQDPPATAKAESEQ